MNLVHSIIPVILPLIYIWNLTTSRQLHYHHPCINHKHLLPILWPWPFTLVPPTDYSLQSSQSSLSLSCLEPSNGFQKTPVLASSPSSSPTSSQPWVLFAVPRMCLPCFTLRVWTWCHPGRACPPSPFLQISVQMYLLREFFPDHTLLLYPPLFLFIVLIPLWHFLYLFTDCLPALLRCNLYKGGNCGGFIHCCFPVPGTVRT